MRYDRDTVTPEEVLSIGAESMQRILELTHYEPRKGDRFFIRTEPNKEYVIEDYRFNFSEDIITYDGDKTISYDDCLPIFTTGLLIDIISFMHSFDLRSFGNGWILLWNSEEMFQSNEDELLVSFLWRALKDLCVAGKLE